MEANWWWWWLIWFGVLIGATNEYDVAGEPRRWASIGSDCFGWDFAKIISMRCLWIEGIACLAQSAAFPCITIRDLQLLFNYQKTYFEYNTFGFSLQMWLVYYYYYYYRTEWVAYKTDRLTNITQVREKAWECPYNPQGGGVRQLFSQKLCHIQSGRTYKQAFQTKTANCLASSNHPIDNCNTDTGLH